MTMTEEECVHKWAEISDKLKTVDNLINELTKAHQKSAEFDNVQVAKLHQAAAFTMTELEKFKVRFTLTQEEIKEHSIQIESDRVEKYRKKIERDEKPMENRPFRIDADAAKRTIVHYTD